MADCCVGSTVESSAGGLMGCVSGVGVSISVGLWVWLHRSAVG